METPMDMNLPRRLLILATFATAAIWGLADAHAD
jgi:hypothetical protein